MHCYYRDTIHGFRHPVGVLEYTSLGKGRYYALNLFLLNHSYSE
jgi:hypothetical protein